MKPLLTRAPLMAAAALLSCLPAPAALKITEFLASNEDGLTDDDGDAEDWIEIQNQGSDPVNLYGWRLTDNAARPDKWIFPSVNLSAGARILVWASEKDRRDPAQPLHTNFKLSSDGEYLGLLRPDGTLEHDYGATYPAQFEDISYGIGQAATEVVLVSGGTPGGAAGPSSGGSPGRWKVPADGNADVYLAGGALNPAPWIATNYDDSAWTAVTGGVGYDTNTAVNYLPHIGAGGNCQTAVLNVRQTIYMRWPFTVSEPANITKVVLKMKYDDGFIVYLNGNPTVLAHKNDPGGFPGWTAAGPTTNADASAIVYENFTFPGGGSSLQAGQNALCIHGLNSGIGSSDLLMTPELVATVVSGPVGLAYFTEPTPVEANSAGTMNPGPLVKDVPQGFPRPLSPVAVPGSPTTIPVTARVVATNNPVADIRLKSRIMFNAETEVPMIDSGTNGDDTAGDGIYTALMSIATLGKGEMVRWRVVATDTTAVTGSSPQYLDATDSPQYFGAVAQDTRLEYTQLPVLHWFIQSPTAADNASGARCALYYQDSAAVEGEFYDNILMNTHGQSTAGFAKKSYDIDFNHDARFRYKTGERRVKDINLLTNWADKSKVRNTVTWAAFWDTGSYGHFSFPVRVNRNGTFFSIADMVEDGDDRYLERAGLDPNGALYKMYNTLDSATSGVEKKSRRWENNNNDLAAFIAGLNPGTSLLERRRYAYDNLDIPCAITYLACGVLTNSQDQGHKNYYLYRDSDGNREWKVLPWDNDLAMGHTWTSAQNYFDDDIDSQRGLQNGASNRLKQLIFGAPEINRLFTRRLRSIMDQYLISSTSTTGLFETQINDVLNLIDPPGAGTNSDAWLDYQAWGHWTDGNNGAKINPTQAGWDQHGPRASAARILSANPNPPYPTSTAYVPYVYQGVNPPTTAPFLPGRRSFLYSTSAVSGAERVPAAQVANPNVVISTAEANPGIGDQEYLVIRNNEPVSVDISGWTVTGAVDFTFRGGTVIPPYTTGAENVGLLFVCRNATAFRNRTASPKRGEFCYLVGPYDGQLSARGETIELRDGTGAIVSTFATPAVPTAAQQALRVTEILFKPTTVTAAERLTIPTLITEDFEFIELMNTGAAPLDIGGAQFIEGVTFTFPLATVLAPGARTLIVANSAAFALRHPGVTNIAGQYTGQLDNNGETLDLIDARGETILEFSYNDKWYPPTDELGHSLVVLDPVATPYHEWDKRTRWGVSMAPGGSAGTADSEFAMIYEFWENTVFTALERDDPLVSSVTANPDSDAAENLLEYAFGSDPKSSAALLPAAQFITAGGQSYLSLTFRRRTGAIDVIYEPEVSTDLGQWSAISIQAGAPVSNGDGTETVTIRDSVPWSTGRRQFIHLKVTKLF